MEKLNKFGHANPFQPHFHPFGFEENNHAVEKADASGNKHRHLIGVSSGLNEDAHGERMTQKAIGSFMTQAQTGNLLLYPDVHGIKASNDIGKLVECSILPNGDWRTDYQLYNETDFDPILHREKFATIDSIWKQMLGLPPYTVKKQKGFSIEGHIPDGGFILSPVQKRIIDEVMLDGTVLVPRPAYQTGIANAVFKCIGDIANWQEDHIRKNLQSKMQEIITRRQADQDYNETRWELERALSETVEEIMRDSLENKKERLEIVFAEFKDIMIQNLMAHSQLFIPIPASLSGIALNKNRKEIHMIYKKLQSKMMEMKQAIYTNKEKK